MYDNPLSNVFDNMSDETIVSILNIIVLAPNCTKDIVMVRSNAQGDPLSSSLFHVVVAQVLSFASKFQIQAERLLA